MSIDSNLLGSEAQHLFDQAMKLSVTERAKLADKLSSTIDPPSDQEWQAAWSPEIARRVAEIENGDAKLSSWEDARRALWEGFDARSDS